MSSGVHYHQGYTAASYGNPQAMANNNVVVPLAAMAAQHDMPHNFVSENTAALLSMPSINSAQARAGFDMGDMAETAAMYGREEGGKTSIGQRVSASVSKYVTQETPVESSGGGILDHYNQYTIDIDSAVVVSRHGHRLTIWLPKPTSDVHCRTTQFSVNLQAYKANDETNEGEKINLQVEGLSMNEIDSVKDVIQKFVNVTAKHSNIPVDLIKNYQTKGESWDFVPCTKPVIQKVTWEKAVNKLAAFNVGISFSEENGQGGQRGTGQEKLNKIKYQRGGFTKDYQIVVEPSVAAAVHSDSLHHQGALLKSSGYAEQNPFIFNGQCTNFTGSTENVQSEVRLDSLEILWALQNMLFLLPLYIDAVESDTNKGKLWEEQRTATKNNNNIQDVLRALTSIEDDKTLNTGEKISAVLSVMARIFMKGTGNNANLWKLKTDNGKYIYHVPSIFHRIAHKHYNQKLSEQKVFNSGTELSVKAEALPCAHNAKLDDEDVINSVLVQFRVKGYYPQLGYCYLRLDYDE